GGRGTCRRAHARGRVHPPDRKGPAMTTHSSRSDAVPTPPPTPPPSPVAQSPSPGRPLVAPARVFFAVLSRDLHVTRKELAAVLAQVLVQPFFFLFVFANVLGSAGFVSTDYGKIMLPGLIALNALFGALQ